MASTTTLFLVALLLVSSVCGDLCATCNKPQDILRGKPAILDQFNDANGRLTLFYFTFRGYVYERCSNEDCSATEGAVTALPGSFDGNKPFGAALMGNSIVAVTAQPTGQSWTVTVAINGNVVSSFPVYGQLTDMEVIGSTSSPAFIGLTGKNQGKNFAIVYTVGTTGITGPAVAETSATSNQPNTISGIVGNGGQAIFVTTTDGNLVSVVACANPTCTSVRSTPVEKFAAVSTQQGVSITLRNNYPVIFVAVPNLPLQVAYCTDVFCSARTISTTAHPSNPQTSSLAPDGTVIVASNRGSSVIVVKCQDAVCTEESVPLQVNGLSNPLVSLIPSPTGVVLLLKTLQRALLVNLCGPFPQSLSPVEVTTTVKAELTIQGVGFCPQDSIARLEDYPFPARYVSPNEVRVALGPNVLPGSYQVGLQNQDGQRFGVVLSSDLSVKNGCPLNCSGHVGHGYCNGFAGKCACNPGWTGSDCGQPANGSPCPNCGPNGVCDAQTRQCRCFNGYSGPTCSNTGKTCPNACNGHGKCNFATGECKCSFFWCGAGCTKIWPLCS